MAQIKIYGLKQHLNPMKAQLSDVIHACVVKALAFPPDKRAHRFFPLEVEDFYYPSDRSPADLEITMTETPRHNWGFRGQVGDEISFNYSIEV